MKKKAICILMCVVLVFVMCPMTAFAMSSGEIMIDGNTYSTAADASGTGWNWDAANMKLTLCGYDGGSIFGLIDSLTIEAAEGTNNIIHTESAGGALTNGGNTEITGKGNLKIQNLNILGSTDLAGIDITGDLIISLSGKLEASSVNGYAIRVEGGIIKYVGSGDLILTGLGGIMLGAISQPNQVIINGTGDVRIDATLGSCIFDLNGNITIGGSGSFVAKSSSSYSVYMTAQRQIYIEEQSATYVKFESGVSSIANSTSDPFVLDPSTTYVKTGDWDTNSISFERGVASIGTTNLTGSQMLSNIVDDPTWSWDAGTKELTLKGYNDGKIDLQRPVNGIVLQDGTDNVITNSSAGSPALYAQVGDLTIKGNGNLTVNSEGAGIQSKGTATINGSGDIEVNSKQRGIQSDSGSVVLSGSNKVSVTSQENDAIYINGAANALFLNGTGHPISLAAGSGKKAVNNGAGDGYAVAGTKFSTYAAVDGAFNSESVVYDFVTPGSNGNEEDVAGVAITAIAETGDYSNLIIWFALLGLSILGVGTIVMYKKKREM